MFLDTLWVKTKLKFACPGPAWRCPRSSAGPRAQIGVGGLPAVIVCHGQANLTCGRWTLKPRKCNAPTAPSAPPRRLPGGRSGPPATAAAAHLTPTRDPAAARAAAAARRAGAGPGGPGSRGAAPGPGPGTRQGGSTSAGLHPAPGPSWPRSAVPSPAPSPAPPGRAPPARGLPAASVPSSRSSKRITGPPLSCCAGRLDGRRVTEAQHDRHGAERPAESCRPACPACSGRQSWASASACAARSGRRLSTGTPWRRCGAACSSPPQRKAAKTLARSRTESGAGAVRSIRRPSRPASTRSSAHCSAPPIWCGSGAVRVHGAELLAVDRRVAGPSPRTASSRRRPAASS